MKKLKEFLIMFISYLVLGITWFCYFAFQFECYNINDILKMFEIFVTNKYLMIALFFTYVPATLAALLLTAILALLLKKKRELLGRKKYYIFLLLTSIVAPFIICNFVLIETWDVIFKTICILQIAIMVVFIHWVIEWIGIKSKSRKSE